ncbi:MAG: 4-hydroxy-tetrahydrodipicolinate reductase [Gammaproteobacteria bacterium]|nr:4-hydroxy-tetrahydrodipicolinate reductase [Gammaproteobacteria bacterium]
MIGIGITGVNGRMGRSLVQAAQARDDMKLASATVRRGSELAGTDAGQVAGIPPLGVAASETLRDDVDVVVDFTLPDAALENVAWCRARGKRIVIGTTGFDSGQRAQIEEAARDIAIVLAPNMSVGVNLCFRLVELAARTVGDSSDIEIIEAHHRHKADAPSGTALRLGEKAAGALGRRLEDVAVYERHGPTGPRPDGAIGFATVRAGDIVGEHTVLFAGDGERIEITHKATSRLNFANGALRAAAWLAEKDAGLYDMQDVLGL